MTCVEPLHFDDLDGIIEPMPWMQQSRVATALVESKSGSYAVAGGGNKNDLLQSITLTWLNDTPVVQLVWGEVRRGGCRVSLQARSRGFLTVREGVQLGVTAPTLTAADEVSKFGTGMDVGQGGFLATDTGLAISDVRDNSRRHRLLPGSTGRWEVAVGQSITVRVEVRFQSEAWQSALITGGSEGTNSNYVSGDTAVDLFAVPKF
ncbi:uncharacterized protein RMCC_5857 [Mycolicibacterium canariasense]|uniref:Uncharacterized protein n=1 Tax=Mycolicibacterium canariasense TaxID=228230 RepID=A0A100WIF6_MYCCR|nr:hypothetical protein [Mycolicibacterium canariasense]MCV7213146.1 hypothetical protein [Mycolicibacterium canariasense]ORU98499.1 hypothetical protein AWB94_28570 [Mycolicibacterium canariasense]GAS98892.1 uncharacterized protein RMCC_5857 [Mycolicibacterium canariasense]